MEGLKAVVEELFPRCLQLVDIKVSDECTISGPGFRYCGPMKYFAKNVHICDILQYHMSKILLENRHLPPTNDKMPHTSKYIKIWTAADEIVMSCTPLRVGDVSRIEEYVIRLESMADVVDILPLPIAEEIIHHLA